MDVSTYSEFGILSHSSPLVIVRRTQAIKHVEPPTLLRVPLPLTL
jgi:hypothetical protein